MVSGLFECFVFSWSYLANDLAWFLSGLGSFHLPVAGMAILPEQAGGALR